VLSEEPRCVARTYALPRTSGEALRATLWRRAPSFARSVAETRLFSHDDLHGVILPPSQRFLRRWQPGDPP